jgi:hypothetical protein
MCGLAPLTGRNKNAGPEVYLSHRKNLTAQSDLNSESPGENVRAKSLTTPCREDCAISSAFAASKWESKKAALSYQHQPRPPSARAMTFVVSKLIHDPYKLCLKSIARPPPGSLS